MKNFLDKLQQAWQSQCSKPLDVNPDQLLNVVRLERRVNFWTDIVGSVVLFLWCGVLDVSGPRFEIFRKTGPG